MCFYGQKIQPTLISGDKMSEAGTDKTLPILEQVIKNHQNLPKPNSTPYICLVERLASKLCQGFEYNEHACFNR